MTTLCSLFLILGTHMVCRLLFQPSRHTLTQLIIKHLSLINVTIRLEKHTLWIPRIKIDIVLYHSFTAVVERQWVAPLVYIPYKMALYEYTKWL